jgi:F0F1-type ATP synthase membrane subunit b/b'
MGTSTTQQGPSATVKAYGDKITAQLQDAKGKLAQLEARAKETKAQAEIATVNSLKTAKQNIDRKLQDLKTTHDTYVARAKADIDADVAKFKASVDDFAAKVKTASTKR